MVTANVAKAIYTGGSFTRNPSFWLNGVDLTCCAANLIPYNTTLISPRHIIFAAHAGPWLNTPLNFVTNDNQVITRTVTSTLIHPDFQPYYPDLGVGVLNQDLPSSISFAKVLPKDWTNYIKVSPGSYGADSVGRIAAVGFTQDRYASPRDWIYASLFTYRSIPNVAKPRSIVCTTPTDPLRQALYQDIRGGDSSSPLFIIIDNEPILLTCWTFGGPGSGTSIAEHADAINTMMTTLGGGYQLTTVDLRRRMTLKSLIFDNSQVLPRTLTRPVIL